MPGGGGAAVERQAARTVGTSVGVPGVGAVPPRLAGLWPPKGHVRGGTLVTIRGAGFRKTSGLVVRFAAEGDVREVPAAYVSASAVTCETPPAAAPHTAHVTVSNGDGVFSGCTCTTRGEAPRGTDCVAPALIVYRPAPVVDVLRYRPVAFGGGTFGSRQRA